MIGTNTDPTGESYLASRDPRLTGSVDQKTPNGARNKLEESRQRGGFVEARGSLG